MGIEKVKDDIIESAKSQASITISQAKIKASEILRETEGKIDGYRESSSEETKKVLLELKRQEIAKAELEAKKLFLQSKKEITNMAFGQAEREVTKLKEKEMSEIILCLLNKAKQEIEIEYVYCNKRDSKFITGFKVIETEIDGLIAENKDRSVRVDYSFSALFQSLMENNLQEIAQKLFE